MQGTNFRGIVLSKYKTIGAFASDIGWNRQKASRIVNGLQDPDIQDIQDMTRVLNIDSPDEFVRIFFSQLYTMWTTLEEGA